MDRGDRHLAVDKFAFNKAFLLQKDDTTNTDPVI